MKHMFEVCLTLKGLKKKENICFRYIPLIDKLRQAAHSPHKRFERRFGVFLRSFFMLQSFRRFLIKVVEVH